MKDPKGRTSIAFEKHIFICENSRASGHPRGCCQEKEGSKIKMMFKDEIVKNDLVGKVRANGSTCLDFCEQGPTIVIYPEGVWYRIDNPEKDVKDIIKKHIIEDEIVERCVIKL
jgi:(2Fe-2S) ferredoxin